MKPSATSKKQPLLEGSSPTHDSALPPAVPKILEDVHRLVLAPTSVCPNWEAELCRFAPTLAVHRLRNADERTRLVQNMAADMVLIVGYGLLPKEAATLAAQSWSLLVFDEPRR